MSDFKNFKIRSYKDASDPGFEVPGVRFRWISGKVRERSSTSGLWIPLRKSKIPKELVDHVERRYPGAFADGDTVRRGNGELVLAYSTAEEANKHRKELDKLANEQASRARIMPRQEDVGTKNDFARITDYEAEASSIPSQFLGKNNKE